MVKEPLISGVTSGDELGGEYGRTFTFYRVYFTSLEVFAISVKFLIIKDIL